MRDFSISSNPSLVVVLASTRTSFKSFSIMIPFSVLRGSPLEVFYIEDCIVDGQTSCHGGALVSNSTFGACSLVFRKLFDTS